MNAETAKYKELFEVELELSYTETKFFKEELEELTDAINLCVASGHLKEDAFTEAKQFVKKFYIKRERTL